MSEEQPTISYLRTFQYTEAGIRLKEAAAWNLAENYSNILTDLQQIDPSLITRFAQDLTRVIFYHRDVGLKPVVLAAHDKEAKQNLVSSSNKIEKALSRLGEAYNRRTGKVFAFERNSASAKGAWELLLLVVIEMIAPQSTQELISAVTEHRNGDGTEGLLSFKTFVKRNKNCGCPAAICIAERRNMNGQLTYIVGSSRIKIQGFKELQEAFNNSRSLRFTDEEREEMLGKVYRNRERVKERLDQNAGRGAARLFVKETATRDEYWEHPHVLATAYSLVDGFISISPCWGCFSLFRFRQYIGPEGINWEGIDNAEIGGGKFGHASCAESIVHLQCARLDAEEQLLWQSLQETADE